MYKVYICIIKTRCLLSSAWADALRTSCLSSGCVLSTGMGNGLGRNLVCLGREPMAWSLGSLKGLLVHRAESWFSERGY